MIYKYRALKSFQEQIIEAIKDSSIDGVNIDTDIDNEYVDIFIGKCNIYIETNNLVGLPEAVTAAIRIIKGSFDRGIDLNFQKSKGLDIIQTSPEALALYY